MPIVRNYVNWTLSRAAGQFSMLRGACGFVESRQRKTDDRENRRETEKDGKDRKRFRVNGKERRSEKLKRRRNSDEGKGWSKM